MTRTCTFKEAFIEKQLDKFQPNWRNGEDITAETKQKIKDYVASQMPDELKESASCITDYSIWHMAKKIRKRENLPDPKKSNKGMPVVAPTDCAGGLQKSSSEGNQKVNECKPQIEKVSKCEPNIEEKSSEGLNQKEQVEHKQEPNSDKPVAALGDFDELLQEIKNLVSRYSLENVKKALAVVAEIK